YEGGGGQPDALLRGRELRPMHALPGGNREGRHADGNRALGSGVVDGALRRHARRLDLRAWPGGAQPVAVCVEVFSGGAGEAARKLVMKKVRRIQVSSPRTRGPIIADGGYGSRLPPPPAPPPAAPWARRDGPSRGPHASEPATRRHT